MTTPIRITADVEVLDNATRVSLAGPATEHLKMVGKTLGIDVVRHPLVQRIILAYERRDAELEQKRSDKPRAERGQEKTEKTP